MVALGGAFCRCAIGAGENELSSIHSGLPGYLGVVDAGAEVEVVAERLGFDEAEGEGVLHEIDTESTDGGGGCAAADQFGGDEEMSFVDEAGIEEGAEGL